MADQPAVTQPQTPEPQKYILKFEPIEPFTEAELFAKGFVRGKTWISDQKTAVLRSLTGEETDKIDEACRIKPGMSQREYNTLTTYYNLAYAVEMMDDQKLNGTVEDKVKHLKALAAPILTRLSLAWLEFNARVDELFVGKGGVELAKKS